MSYVIGLDIGTTSTKAVVFDLNGQVVSSHAVSYPLYQPQTSWVEQDPEEILRAVVGAVQTAVDLAGVRPEEILAVGFSSAMHSLIVMDAKHRPLTRVVIWADNRSVKQAEKLRKSPDGLRLYRRTGTPIHPMSPMTKLMWLREEAPEIFRQAAKFISIKEYVLFHLFGEYVVDYSIASATGLFHLTSLDWDEEILQMLGIKREQLSRLVPTTEMLQGMNPALAAKMNLNPNTPFIIGASDGVLANVGVGAIEPGEVAVTIGTSGAIRGCVDRPITDEKGRTFCYALTDNKWVIGGATNNGGILMNWFRDEFSMIDWEKAKQTGQNPYETVLKEVESVPAGAEGLLCLPFFTGERAPYWDAELRGSFFGVGLHHKKGHFIRSMLEGISFNILSIAAVLEELAGPIWDVRASGGFVRSSLWVQILTDVLGKKVWVPQSPEASALGAAALALYRMGEIRDLVEVKKWVSIIGEHQPNAKNHEVYQSLFSLYDRLAHKLIDEFHEIAEFQRSKIGRG